MRIRAPWADGQGRHKAPAGEDASPPRALSANTFPAGDEVAWACPQGPCRRKPGSAAAPGAPCCAHSQTCVEGRFHWRVEYGPGIRVTAVHSPSFHHGSTDSSLPFGGKLSLGEGLPALAPTQRSRHSQPDQPPCLRPWVRIYRVLPGIQARRLTWPEPWTTLKATPPQPGPTK